MCTVTTFMNVKEIKSEKFSWNDNFKENANLSYTAEQMISSEIKFQENSQQTEAEVISRRHVSLTNTYNSPKVKSLVKKEDELEVPKSVLWSSENIKLGWRSVQYRGSGFVNLGNTCYLNSSLQALFHIPSFANWLLQEFDTHMKACQRASQYSAFCSICAMMELLRLTSNSAHGVIKPNLIHGKLKCIGKTLMYNRQEDAHEFTKMLLYHMERAYVCHRQAYHLDHRSKETTPLNQIFGGYLRQQVICPACNHISTTFSHFQDLNLDLHNCNNIEDALSLHFRKETLDCDNAYKCEECHKKVAATKKHIIEQAPHVMLLQLKRFSASGGKIGRRIAVPKELNMSRYIKDSKRLRHETGYSYIYELVSMVNHLGGSHYSGHYTAMAKASNGTMFEFDDSSVTSISINTALNSNPYIVFYELKEKPNSKLTPSNLLKQKSQQSVIKEPSASPSPTLNNSGHRMTPLPPDTERRKVSLKLSGPNNTLGRNTNGKGNVNNFEPASHKMQFSSVNSWEGGKSALGSEIEKDKARYLHRTDLDRYNEEFDSGKYPKKKRDNFVKRRNEGNVKNRNELNPFQHHNQNKGYKSHWQGNSYKHGLLKPKFNHQKSWRDKRPHPYNYNRNSQKSWHDRNRNSYKKDLYA